MTNRRIAGRNHRRGRACVTRCLVCIVLSCQPLFGATKSAPKGIPDLDEDRALVLMIRAKSRHGRLHTNLLFANDRFMGAVDNDCYTYAYVEPGEVLLWTEGLWSAKILNLIGGQAYVARVNWGEINTVKPSTFAAATDELGRVNSHCEPTPKEIAIAEKKVQTQYPEAVLLQGRTCGDCDERRVARKILDEWPKVDLTPYQTLRIDFSITDPTVDKKKWVAERAAMAERRFPPVLERELLHDLFQEIVTSETDGSPQTVITKVEYLRYARDPRAYLDFKKIAIVNFRASLVDSESRSELASFSGHQANWKQIRSHGTNWDWEEALAFALARYLEPCKCGDLTALSDPGPRHVPSSCRALSFPGN